MNKIRSIFQRKPKEQQPLVAPEPDPISQDVAVDAADAAPSDSLTIQIQNRTNSSNVYAYVTGQALDNGNKICLIKSDGKTPYYPTSPSAIGTAIKDNVSIKLGAPGTTKNVTIPHLAGGRLWFSVDKQLTFLLNPGPAIVEPSISNPSDPNININWAFCEFTFGNGQIYANISYVDFVSLPISMTLTHTTGEVQKVAGLKPDGLQTICNGLEALKDSKDWSKLVYKVNGQRLRALSPNNGIVMNGGNLFKGYYDIYVNQVWDKYGKTDLVVDTQAQWGVVRGRVKNGKLEFPGNGSMSKPSTGDIFSCSTGPFADNTAALGPLTARISAALNRSTLLINPAQPTKEKVSTFYKSPTTNHYSRLVHEANLDGRGYAFPYDDVPAPGDVDQSGFVNGPPKKFQVSIG